MWGNLFSNKIIWATLFSWFIAQSLKIIFNVLREKRFKISWVITTGGMPSSHAASVTTLATCIGIEGGFSSALFALASIFALVTMFDAQTWRRSIGIQARILNNIMEDVYAGRKVEEDKLRELIGHTPVEVFVGAVLGALISFAFYL